MKKFTLPLVLAAVFAAAPAFAHERHGQPEHGGVVAEAGHAQFEIVAKEGLLTVHASNHGQPLATAGTSGKLTVLAGGSKQEFVLQAAGEDRLQGAGTFSAGDKLLLRVTWPGGKTLQARAVAH